MYVTLSLKIILVCRDPILKLRAIRTLRRLSNRWCEANFKMLSEGIRKAVSNVAPAVCFVSELPDLNIVEGVFN